MKIYKFEFQFHQKDNQKLKYLNKGSTHMNETFNVIPNGILDRLTKLASMTVKILNKSEQAIPSARQCFDKSWFRSKNIFEFQISLEEIRCLKID